MTGLKGFGDVTRYSSALFDCLDSRSLEIAKYLILNGFETEVYKQVRIFSFTFVSFLASNDICCLLITFANSLNQEHDQRNVSNDVD